MKDIPRPDSQWDPLADAARADAARGMPRFSAPLHARVMRAVGSARQSPPSDESLSLKPFALAAVALLACTFAARLYFASSTRVATGPTEKVAPRAQAVVLNTPPVRATLASWGRQESALEADLGPTQLAGLDHDARVAARYVLDPLSLPPRQR